ncbi:MAG: hypothetical protein WBN92_18620 [Terriglobia bacterium]
MKYFKYLAILCMLMIPAAGYAAHVSVGVFVGPAYGYGPPVCPYGYYGYYPYPCAPYGYYGPDYFVSGVFIGAGPWFGGFHRGFGNSFIGGFGRGPFVRDFRGRQEFGRGPFVRDFRGSSAFGRGHSVRDFRGGSSRGGSSRGASSFRGNSRGVEGRARR